MKKQYSYDSPSYEFDFLEKEKAPKQEKEKPKRFEESREVKNEIVFQQFMNDLYEKIHRSHSGFNLKKVEKLLIKNLLPKYTRTEAAKILGISIRTLRNKINEYGYKDIRKDNSILH